MASDPIDLGHGHTAVILGVPVPTCAHIDHLTPDGQPCGSAVSWSGEMPPSHTWQLLSLNPLHVEPSILCRRCGDHGWIRQGRWVPAEPS